MTVSQTVHNTSFTMSFQEAQEPLAKRTKICGHCNRELSLVAYKTHLHRFLITPQMLGAKMTIPLYRQ